MTRPALTRIHAKSVARWGRRNPDSADVLLLVLATAVMARFALPDVWRIPIVAAWTLVFAAVCIQATPYVALGVAVSAVVALLPDQVLQRLLPRRTWVAVPVAATLGALLPGCECGSVPVAVSMLRRGVATGPAMALMASAPATNPVVLTATAAAFPGRPGMVLARFCGSLLVSFTVGWWRWRTNPVARADITARHEHGRCRPAALLSGAARDLSRSLGMVTIGAASAATLGVLVPRSVFTLLAGSAAGGVATLAVLAVVLAVCSEADAFIASSFTSFSASAQLTFMIVGPVVDVKLFAMHVGAFGTRFAVRFGSVGLLAAMAAAVLVGELML